MGDGKAESLAEAVSYLNEMVRFQALTIAELILVVQYFVRERCDSEPIVPADLEKQWNAAAEVFRRHAEWVKTKTEARPDAE